MSVEERGEDFHLRRGPPVERLHVHRDGDRVFGLLLAELRGASLLGEDPPGPVEQEDRGASPSASSSRRFGRRSGAGPRSCPSGPSSGPPRRLRAWGRSATRGRRSSPSRRRGPARRGSPAGRRRSARRGGRPRPRGRRPGERGPPRGRTGRGDGRYGPSRTLLRRKGVRRFPAPARRLGRGPEMSLDGSAPAGQSLRPRGRGQVSERFKEHGWKPCVVERLPWVRIPPCPPRSAAGRSPFFALRPAPLD